MSTKSEQALGFFYRGFSCAQSVLAPFAADLGMSEQSALRLAAPFGAGLGRMRGTCGAFSSLCMVAGHCCGNTEGTVEGKERIYRLTRELAERFTAAHGSLLCRELLHLEPGQSEPAAPGERSPAYYEGRPCMRCIAWAAAEAEQLLHHPPSEPQSPESPLSQPGRVF